MEQVPAGVSLPFEVSYETGLSYVAMTVYNTTTGSPVLVGTYPMTETLYGTYLAFFTPTVNNSYLLHTQVYTSNTYTTPDGVHSSGSETFIGVNSINGAPGGSNGAVQAAIQQFTIVAQVVTSQTITAQIEES
jgi:hypothetical protein